MTSELLLMHRIESGDGTFDDHITLAQGLLSKGWAARMPTHWAEEAYSWTGYFSPILDEPTTKRGDDDMSDVNIKIKFDQDEIASIEIEGQCTISVSDSEGEQIYETAKAIFSSSDCREKPS